MTKTANINTTTTLSSNTTKTKITKRTNTLKSMFTFTQFLVCISLSPYSRLLFFVLFLFFTLSLSLSLRLTSLLFTSLIFSHLHFIPLSSLTVSFCLFLSLSPSAVAPTQNTSFSFHHHITLFSRLFHFSHFFSSFLPLFNSH